MKVAVFNTKSYEKPFFENANDSHELFFIQEGLNINTVSKAIGCNAICCFVTDELNKEVLTHLHQIGIKLIALRSAGYDHVDLKTAFELQLPIVRVPNYSPEAIAEFTIGMILALSRKLLRAHDRIRQHNFSLVGQLGFNLNNKTVGIIGTGRIGALVAKLLLAFGCTVLAYDPKPNEACKELNIIYTSKEELYQQSDIITLHCPLNKETRHIINNESIAQMRPDSILINTGRGALINTTALIDALKNQKFAAVGLDVYEYEQGLFFEDHSGEIIKDEQFIQLQSFPNVLITGHQAYFTEEALTNIAHITLDNITAFEHGIIQNQICYAI